MKLKCVYTGLRFELNLLIIKTNYMCVAFNFVGKNTWIYYGLENNYTVKLYWRHSFRIWFLFK